MSTLEIAPANPDNAYHLAPHLCESDRIFFDTVVKDGDVFLAEYMDAFLSDADQIFQLHRGGEIHGILGHRCYDPLFRVGEIFILSSEELWEDNLLSLTKKFRRDLLPGLFNIYDSVVCTVRKNNTALLSWIVSCGFKPTRMTSVDSETFILMEISKW